MRREASVLSTSVRTKQTALAGDHSLGAGVVMAPRRLLLLAAVVTAARGQAARTADPSSCRRYMEDGAPTAVSCPEPLLFDTVSSRCMPAPVATCGSGQ